MEVSDFMAVLFNPVAQAKYVHTVSAGYVTGSVFVLAISAWYLLKGRHVEFAKRPLNQTFEYDWLGNTAKTGDDAKGFYDRSLGTIEQQNAAKPYQLTHAKIADGPKAGELWAKYDDAGNLTRLNVRRDGTCLGGTCSQRFEYRWDEVGRLVRARRWDTNAGIATINADLPTEDPAADLRNAYDAGDQRVIKEAVDEDDNDDTLDLTGGLGFRVYF